MEKDKKKVTDRVRMECNGQVDQVKRVEQKEKC